MAFEFKDYDAKFKSLDEILGQENPSLKEQEIYEKVSSILEKKEKVQHLLIQNLFSFRLYPYLLVLTDIRIILVQPGVGSMKIHSMRWRMFKEVYFYESIRGACLRFASIDGHQLKLDCLPKELSRKAFSYAQGLEMPADEYRRHRWMQEEFAKDGMAMIPSNTKLGDVIPSLNSPNSPQLQSSALSSLDKMEPLQALRELKKVFDENLITSDEYLKKKSEILNKF